MTDVPISSPAPSAAPTSSPAPAPSAREVPINQNPVSQPDPIGSQAPQAPPPSRRETIQAAYDRASKPQPKPAERAEPKAAEAKPGHNNPPEETPRLNLKKRPDEQGEPQPRDRGRFAPREQQRPEMAGNAADNSRPLPADPGQPHAKLPPHAPYAEPPPRMAEHGKRDWATTPETVRGEVHRMHQEFGKAAQHWQAQLEPYRAVEPYRRMAEEHGTTLDKALANYTGIESKLRADPIGGLDLIVHNLGLKDPQTGQPIGLRDIAYHVLNQSPEQLLQVQQGNQQAAAKQHIGQLYQKIQGLEQVLQQWQNAQQFTYTRSAVDQFAETHPRVDELGALIKQEIDLGFDLETAYRRAELLSPATHAAQTRNPPAQTRPMDRSISGAPDVAPSNGASRPRKSSPTARDAVQNAMARMNGVH